ncbi:hypothetical protein OG738_17785 [Amycolatopsis sp. NBC_01488]|uniref:hypothetical protein n=1 Tax=Amycolatopsis sp. NBC_01488 TaxID=2903563 RepID=UPI002E2CA9A6|nr:hypothetical protein [Amycolatopsis sp. NBC_01488]
MITATVVVLRWVTPESGGLKRRPLARSPGFPQVAPGAFAVIGGVGDGAKVYM